MTPPASLDALTTSLGNAALNGELSWQAADRALQLAEESAAKREAERERREWLIYAERVRSLTLSELDDSQLERESHLARAWWLDGYQGPILEAWQQQLADETLRRQDVPA